MKKVFKSLGGQKWTGLIVIIIWTTAFFWAGKIPWEGAVELVKWSFGAFVLGNTANGVTALIKDKE